MTKLATICALAVLLSGCGLAAYQESADTYRACLRSSGASACQTERAQYELLRDSMEMGQRERMIYRPYR